jgi:hypothetical protein
VGLQIGSGSFDDLNPSLFNSNYMNIFFSRVGGITWMYRRL